MTSNATVTDAAAPPYSDFSQSEIIALSSHFRAKAIRGPDAFVEMAIEFTGFQDAFQDAMARKLLKELQARAVGALGPPDL